MPRVPLESDAQLVIAAFHPGEIRRSNCHDRSSTLEKNPERQPTRFHSSYGSPANRCRTPRNCSREVLQARRPVGWIRSVVPRLAGTSQLLLHEVVQDIVQRHHLGLLHERCLVLRGLPGMPDCRPVQ